MMEGFKVTFDFGVEMACIDINQLPITFVLQWTDWSLLRLEYNATKFSCSYTDFLICVDIYQGQRHYTTAMEIFFF